MLSNASRIKATDMFMLAFSAKYAIARRRNSRDCSRKQEPLAVLFKAVNRLWCRLPVGDLERRTWLLIFSATLGDYQSKKRIHSIEGGSYVNDWVLDDKENSHYSFQRT